MTFTIVELEQNSPEWMEWRNSHIGASDIPIIIEKSKWKTPYQLWKQKLGFSTSDKYTPAMKRVHDLESIILEMANTELNSSFVPMVVQNNDLPWASASLDGIDIEHKCICEIKAPNAEDHKQAKKGNIPEHYYPQVMWQLFVTGYEMCYYVSYHGGEICVVHQKVDYDYIKDELLPLAADFFDCLNSLREPALLERDHIQISDPDFESLAKEWIECHKLAKQYAEKEQFYKNKLISFTDDSNCEGYGIRLTRVSRDGNVDWKRLWKELSESTPQIADRFNPEKYRSQQIGYWKISEFS